MQKTATAPQINFATDLAAKLYAGQPAKLLSEIADLAGLTPGQASTRIDRLKALLKQAQAAKLGPVKDIPKGWYLVDGTQYKVQISKKTGAPYLISKDGEYLGALKGDAPKILAAIEADPLACAIAYGKATTTCGICGIELTNPDSIAAGIGPVCAKKF